MYARGDYAVTAQTVVLLDAYKTERGDVPYNKPIQQQQMSRNL